MLLLLLHRGLDFVVGNMFNREFLADGLLQDNGGNQVRPLFALEDRFASPIPIGVIWVAVHYSCCSGCTFLSSAEGIFYQQPLDLFTGCAEGGNVIVIDSLIVIVTVAVFLVGHVPVRFLFGHVVVDDNLSLGSIAVIGIGNEVRLDELA